MSSLSDNSEDTDEFIQSIRTELEQCPLYTPGYQLIQEEQPPSHLDSPLSSPVKAAQYSTDEDAALDRDIDKILSTFGHSSSNRMLDGYLTDEEYEIELRQQRESSRIADSILAPFNSTPLHRVLDSSHSEPLLYTKAPPSPPDVFMTPMQHFSQHSPVNSWNEKEIQSLKSRIHRQTLHHKSEVEEHLTREREARARLEVSHKENHNLMKAMKAQLVSLQQKIKEMQLEKVRLAQESQQRAETPQEDLNKFKEIADYYKGIAKEQERKVVNLEQLIHGLNAEINQLTSRCIDKDKEMCQLNEKLKEQARGFASDKLRKESETQDMLNKTQKTHHREKVLSVAKLQEDLSQTHSEEICQLRNSLQEDKSRALSRLEEGHVQKITKTEEIYKKLEKDLESSAKKLEAKNDVIKSMEVQHKKEVQQLNSEIQKLQSSLQRTTKELTLNKSQAVARARQESEELTLQRIQQAVESNHKSHQGEAQKTKANLKRVTDELSSVREQNTELVKRDKERQAAHAQFEQRLALQLADELNAHSHIGIATNRKRRGVPSSQKRYSGSMTCLSEIQSPKKESAESILRVLRSANGDLRIRAKEAEQKIEAQQRKIKQMENDHQAKLKQLRRDTDNDSRNESREKPDVTNKKQARVDSELKELETSNTSLREYIHTLEEERKNPEDNVMNDPRVVEALTLLSKLQRRLQVITEDRSNLQAEILKLRELIEKHNMNQASPISPQTFNEKILEYSTLQTKYKILLREKMDLERTTLDMHV